MKKLFLILMMILVIPQFSKAEVVWYPMPAEAYKFGDLYPEAQRLLFAFDYGHALVYERLMINRGKISDPKQFEQDLLKDILVILKNPPNIKVDEADIAPAYVYKFPKIVALFDWSHLLHQFVLDILATSKDRGAGLDRRISEVYQQYNATSRLAITDVCKTMLFMDGHYFSKAFRRNFPSFNLLIWSYHWFQIRLYDALLKPTKIDRDKAVAATVKEFWDLIADLPDSAPFDMMPETAIEAPAFASRFPKIPGAFDNNHMLHDIVSDLLVSDKVKESDMRSEGLRMASQALDPSAFKANLCIGYP
ncbi:MAG: hypothetical protein AB7F86_18680 [Bdellovibrionales bacterium]